MKVLQFPLARITFGFILGILVAFYAKPDINYLLGLLFLSFSLFIVSYFTHKRTIYFGICTYLFVVCLGTITQTVHTDSYQKNNYIHNVSAFEKPQLITLIIREQLKKTNFNDRYIAIINQIGSEKNSGKIIVNLPKDSLNHTFETGSCLQIKGVLIRNKNPDNPNQFDYGNYLEQKQIYAQLYADTEAITIGSVFKKDIWYYISKLRNSIIHNLEKNNFHKKELSVAIALIMGQRQDISPQIIQEYQYAGAIHILSVSGLHVGFILLFLTFILKPIPNTKKGALLKLVIIITCLWIFALIAGLSPSIVRSVTMFSFVAIGYHLRRSVNIYHTLLVSILLILLFQPSFLFDVGFQLSYVALFFIIWFQPLLASLWLPKQKLHKYIWGALTVSFAAQIGTLPLSIYYFHQFPGLFFITNLIIMPLLSFIMVVGVLVMILAAFDYVPLLLVKPLEWSIYYLNKIITTIASFEEFVIHDIPLNFYFLLSSYLLIIASIIWFKKPNFNKLILVLISIIAFQVSYIKTKWDVQNQNEWIVFNQKRKTIIVERHGEKATLFTNDTKIKPKNNTILKSYLVGNFSDVKNNEKLKNLAYFHRNKILILDSLGLYPKDIRPDIVILIQSPKINIDRMLAILKPKIIVADGSNYKKIQNNWKESCLKQKIPFHATAEKGFFKLN
ncbi:ComEC/Rec2 family competence protein [Flavobacterium sp. WC2421]|uniref:ComEC/Rec2 family competence protein n=1 Tax=Flavobacterium sp. WC2416 TaxID=3234141 RepID=A0AB39WDZ9_9FLAO